MFKRGSIANFMSLDIITVHVISITVCNFNTYLDRFYSYIPFPVSLFILFYRKHKSHLQEKCLIPSHVAAKFDILLLGRRGRIQNGRQQF